MTDKPIIFSAPMVRALLDGRKTQTRRVLKPQPPERPAPNCHPSYKQKHPAPYLDAYCGERATAANPRGMSRDWHWWQVDDRPGPVACRAPYAPGDRLWVREAFNAFQFSQDGDNAWPVKIPTLEECNEAEELAYRYGAPKIVYRESDHAREWFADQKWRSPIFCPRWASRLTLIVTDVRVQRLAEISEEDARAEGAPPFGGDSADASRGVMASGHAGNYRATFRDIWNTIHGPGAWEANPWVCAITFDVRRRNIDDAGA